MNTTLEDASTAHRSRTSALSERCDRDGDIKILKERLDTIIIFVSHSGSNHMVLRDLDSFTLILYDRLVSLRA